MSEPLILRLRDEVESICLDEKKSNNQKHILNLFAAMIKCLGPICGQKDSDDELNEILSTNNYENFCKVALRLSKSFVIPYSTRGLEEKLNAKGLSLKDLYLFDRMETKEQMYNHMQKLWKKVPQSSSNNTTFYKLLVGVVVGFGFLGFAKESIHDSVKMHTKEQETQLLTKTSIVPQTCPMRRTDFIAPHNFFRTDTTFNTLPYILWTKIALKYEPSDSMSKNNKIEHLASLLVEDKDEKFMMIEEWNLMIIKHFPEIKFPENPRFNANTRTQLQIAFNEKPAPYLSFLYWVSWINEFLRLPQSHSYNFNENVLQWFHGHPLSNPELQSLLCEMFQVYPECLDSFCYLRSLFFKKEIVTLPKLTKRETQEEISRTKTKLLKQVELQKQQLELQKQQLLQYKVQEVKNLLPISHKKQYLPKFSNVPFPKNTISHIFLQFLDQHKRYNTNTVEDLCKSIMEFTSPVRIRINKSNVMRARWVFSSSSTDDMIQTWKNTWREQGYLKYDDNEDPISFKFRMKISYDESDMNMDNEMAKQDHDIRQLPEMYQLNFVIDVYRLIREEEEGNDVDVESIFVQNAVEWFARKPLSIPNLEPLLAELFDLDLLK